MQNSVNLKHAKRKIFDNSKVKICTCSILDPYFIISVCLLIIWHKISEVAFFNLHIHEFANQSDVKEHFLNAAVERK